MRMLLAALLLLPVVAHADSTLNFSGKYLCRTTSAVSFAAASSAGVRPQEVPPKNEYVVTVTPLDFSAGYLIQVNRIGKENLGDLCKRFVWGDFTSNVGVPEILPFKDSLTCYDRWGRFRFELISGQFTHLAEDVGLEYHGSRLVGPLLELGGCEKI